MHYDGKNAIASPIFILTMGRFEMPTNRPMLFIASDLINKCLISFSNADNRIDIVYVDICIVR